MEGLRLPQRPVCLGSSVGHFSGVVGSIGPMVILSGGRFGFISLAFCLAPQGARKGDHIHQPGPRDVEILTGETRIATLERMAAARPNRVNDTDSAVAVFIDPNHRGDNVIPRAFSE